MSEDELYNVKIDIREEPLVAGAHDLAKKVLGKSFMGHYDGALEAGQKPFTAAINAFITSAGTSDSINSLAAAGILTGAGELTDTTNIKMPELGYSDTTRTVSAGIGAVLGGMLAVGVEEKFKGRYVVIGGMLGYFAPDFIKVAAREVAKLM